MVDGGYREAGRGLNKGQRGMTVAREEQIVNKMGFSGAKMGLPVGTNGSIETPGKHKVSSGGMSEVSWDPTDVTDVTDGLTEGHLEVIWGLKRAVGVPKKLNVDCIKAPRASNGLSVIEHRLTKGLIDCQRPKRIC